MSELKDNSPPDLHSLGTALSEQILSLQARFAQHSKKCDHHVVERLDGCVAERELGPHRQGVGIKRDGKEWKLYFVEEGLYEREPTGFEVTLQRAEALFGNGYRKVQQHYLQWNELTKESLVNKSKAVKLLPRLLVEMEKEYDRRTKMVADALKVVHELDNLLPPQAKGGA